jgi:hypothetical protein
MIAIYPMMEALSPTMKKVGLGLAGAGYIYHKMKEGESINPNKLVNNDSSETHRLDILNKSNLSQSDKDRIERLRNKDIKFKHKQTPQQIKQAEEFMERVKKLNRREEYNNRFNNT